MFSGSTFIPSVVPWRAGLSAVKIDAWEGVVMVAAATGCSKTVPPRAKRCSMKGAVSCRYP